MPLGSRWENSGCFSKLRGVEDEGAASVLPCASAGSTVGLIPIAAWVCGDHREPSLMC